MSVFLDSNIVLYALGDEENKRAIASQPDHRHGPSTGCTTLYTEDLQHSQIIENRLTLLNPFAVPISQ
jgi:predicted nucleic acid-binding protein